MCRMLAFASSDPVDIAPYLQALATFSVCGNFVDRWEKRPGGNHPDGWGIALRQGNEIRVLRSGQAAATDPFVDQVREMTDRFIGHVRYASNPETVNAANSHPFMANGTVLAHNGTFRGTVGAEADERKVSDTLVFLQKLSGTWRERTLHGLAAVLSQMLSDRLLVGEYSAANLLIAAGDSLFALRNYRKDPEYYTLYLKTTPSEAVVASEPLDRSPGWRLLENGELVELRLPAPRSVLLQPVP